MRRVYIGAAAFLHFHEDPAGLFADLRTVVNWDRFPVNAQAQRKAFLSRVRAVLKQL